MSGDLQLVTGPIVPIDFPLHRQFFLDRLVIDDVHKGIKSRIKVQKDMLCKDFYIFDVIKDDGRESDVVNQHDPPGDEDAVAADAGDHYSDGASQHC